MLETVPLQTQKQYDMRGQHTSTPPLHAESMNPSFRFVKSTLALFPSPKVQVKTSKYKHGKGTRGQIQKETHLSFTELPNPWTHDGLASRMFIYENKHGSKEWLSKWSTNLAPLLASILHLLSVTPRFGNFYNSWKPSNPSIFDGE